MVACYVKEMTITWLPKIAFFETSIAYQLIKSDSIDPAKYKY